jgi:hypothetical protein
MVIKFCGRRRRRRRIRRRRRRRDVCFIVWRRTQTNNMDTNKSPTICNSFSSL